MGKGHTNLVPLDTIGPAGSPQRNKLVGAVTQANPIAGVDACPLYQSIIAGYQEMLNGYDPALSNTLVVFTDGRDTTGMDIRQVQRELELLADVTRPIRVVLLGIGPDIKLDELQAIAKTTGGAAFQVNSPEQMQLIFLTGPAGLSGTLARARADRRGAANLRRANCRRPSRGAWRGARGRSR